MVANRHEDTSHAIYEFCSNGLHSAHEVSRLGAIVQQTLSGRQSSGGGEGGEGDKEDEALAAVGVKST